MERRREQNRLAQRRYRQRRRQIVNNAIFQIPSNDIGVALIPGPPPIEDPKTPEQRRSWSTYAPATVDPTKSFCELVADSANLLLGGLSTINMDDVELPSSLIAGRRTGSSGPSGPSGPSPTPAEVVEMLSKSKVYTRTPPSRINAYSKNPASQENNRNADTDKAHKGWVAPLHMAAREGRDKIAAIPKP
ncbi:hypothetical protein F4803DRAFT_279988 [Xylaria telfairii]|nr:hypothetical protein F4803DRAFT_279988 [Xylaria telfairii]